MRVSKIHTEIIQLRIFPSCQTNNLIPSKSQKQKKPRRKSLTIVIPNKKNASRKITFDKAKNNVSSFGQLFVGKGDKPRRFSIGTDLIKELLAKNDITLSKKITEILKFYLFPNTIAFFVILFVKFLISIDPNECFADKFIYIGNGSQKKALVALADINIYWMIWILFSFFEIYQKLYRTFLFFTSMIFIFLFYILSNENTFKWYPIYLFLFFLRLIRYLLIYRNETCWIRITMLLRSQGSALTLLINYGVFLLFSEKANELLSASYRDLIFSFYFIIFFFVLKSSLINFALYACDTNMQNQEQNFLIVLASRIAVCYFISFMSTSFMNFSFSEFGKYFIILSYINNIVGLYTRFNFVAFITLKIYRIWKKKDVVESVKKENLRKKKKKIQKIMSGCTLDISFIGSMRLLICHLWPGNLIYSNCFYPKTNLEGILIFVFLNMSLALLILFFVSKRGEALFVYKGKLNIFVNLYLLFLNYALYEISMSFFGETK